jgi:hypothetical protein
LQHAKSWPVTVANKGSFLNLSAPSTTHEIINACLHKQTIATDSPQP